MAISSFHLLLLLLTPWLGNAMLTSKSTELYSRESRQILFPIDAMPWLQSVGFNDYGSLIRNLDPSVKQRLLAALLTASAAVSENPSVLIPGYKGDTQPNESSNPVFSDSYSNTYGNVPLNTAIPNLPFTMEELMEMESRLGIDTVINIILQTLISQAVSIYLIPAILAFITAIFAG